MVTRAQVEANSYLWPDGTVVYRQYGTDSPTGDRPDCSGYVGGCCWGIKVASINTVSLVTEGWMYEIPFADRRIGDAFGNCGPGTEGNKGHIQLYLGDTATGFFIAEQSGGPPGPRHRTIKSITPGYKTYRFKGITAGPATTGDIDMYLIRAAGSGTYLFTGVYRIYIPSPTTESELIKKLGPVEAVANLAAYGVEWTAQEFYDDRATLHAIAPQIAASCGGGDGDLPDHKHHGAPETGGVVRL